MGFLIYAIGQLFCIFSFFFQTQFISCSSSINSSSHSNVCPPDQRLALLQFRSTLHSTTSGKSVFSTRYNVGFVPNQKINHWKEGEDCCLWDGVTCEEDTGNVIGLDLSCNWLSGPIHFNSTLFHLHHLQRLDLSVNYFEFSQISPKFGSFTNLTHLNLSYSSFYGKIPYELAYLSRLVSLDLEYNKGLEFEASVFKGLVKNLTQLRELYLTNVSMSSVSPILLMNLSSSFTSLGLGFTDMVGNFPADYILSLPKLQYLDLGGDCNLTGSLPSNLSSSLEILDLGTCLFTGLLPAFMGNLTPHLFRFNLEENHFYGEIPPSSKLTSLRYLYIGENNFEGRIPDVFENLTDLVQVSLFANRFVGELPFSIFNLTELNLMDFSSNNLGGLFPKYASGLSKLSYLDLSSNVLNGTIPLWLVSLPALEVLHLYNNSLIGNVSEVTMNSLQEFSLGDNKLTGKLPILHPNKVIFVYSVSGNKFTGGISSSICLLTSLQYLDLSHNSLTGKVPQCLGNFSNKLALLTLEMNAFSGPIPEEFGKNLRRIDLNGNRFGGSLPRSLAKCTRLVVLNVGNNMIYDTFPHWLGILPELMIVALRSNKFYGPVRYSKTHSRPFPRLIIFDISRNNFSGPFPAEYVRNFKAMVNVTAGSKAVENTPNLLAYCYNPLLLTIKGLDIGGDEISDILNGLAVIDLSDNKFEGKIPETVGELKYLKSLNLSHNRFTGDIPSSIGLLTNLEGLDLSSNNLTGEIPKELASLTFLSLLNVSWNKLVGGIPNGKQFSTFENNSYEGNMGLCGFPLSKRCSDDEIRGSQPPPLTTFQGEDEMEHQSVFNWLAISLGYACGIVYGFAMGYFLWSPRWVLRFCCWWRINMY